MSLVNVGLAAVPYMALISLDCLLHARVREISRAERTTHLVLGACILLAVAAAWLRIASLSVLFFVLFIVASAYDELSFIGAFLASSGSPTYSRG